MTGSETVRILHVDDEAAFVDLTAEMLEREDDRFTVETATDPGEGLDRLADHEFDCIVSDFEMPTMDGIEFLSAIRDEYPDLPFILFTGKGSEEVASDAVSAGVTHYLQKRPGTDQYTLLANRIQNAVDQYRASNRADNLARIRTLINEINQALVRANGREEVETAVCEILADAEPYQTVWIGEVTTDRVVPRTAAGVGSGDVTGVSLSTGTADDGPIGRAVTRQEFAVSDAADHRRGSDPSDDGRRAMAVVPLNHEDTLFGVLAVSAEQAEAFDRAERSLLVELGDDIAHALHAVRIQSELERRNDLFRKAQDIADVGAWEYDIGTEDLRWTAEVYEIHDLPRDAAPTHEEALEFYHPEDREAIREAFHRAIDQGDAYDMELRLITADDDHRWVHTRGEPQFEDGEPVRVRGTIQDITERKEREQELERYATIVEASGDPVYTLDADGRFRVVNDALVEMTGYDEQELLGNHFSSILVREDAERGGMVMRSLQESDTEGRTTELTVVRPDGDRVPCEIRVTPLPYEDEFRGIVGVIRDITERTERERELKRQQRETQRLQELLQGALGVTDTYVWEWDLETDEIDRYPAAEHLFGVSPDALGDIDTFLERVHPDDREDIEQTMRSRVESGQGYQLEYRMRTADGSWRWIRDRSDVITDDQGTPVRAVGSITDISEAKAREQERQAVLERYEALFANTNDAIARVEYEERTPIIREANDAFRELFEPPGSSVVGRNLDEVVASDERLEEAREYSRTTADGQFMSAELTRDTVDGPRTFRWQAVPLDGSSDPEDGLEAYAVYTDITERTEHQRDLELYRTMVETVPDAVYALDEDFHYIAVNSAMAELTGYSKSELVGSHLSLVVDDDPVESARENREKLLESEAEVLTHEYVHRTADGEEIPVENRFRLLPSDHEFRGTAGVIRDISHRKERERQVRQQREHLERREEKLIDLRDYTQELMYAGTLAETADIALSAIDEILGFDLGAVFRQADTQDGLLEAVEVLNESRMEKMYGGLPAFVRDAPAGTHSELAWDVFETGDPVFINDTAESERLTRKSPFGSLMMYPIGQHGVVLLAATRLEAFTETEEILLDLLATALETAFDRVEREHDLRRQRDELERQNERLEQFASVVSHDLRNPLNVAAARVDLASEECESAHLADVENALDRMDTLISDILAVAREGKQVRETEVVTLAETTETCWANVRTDAATLDIETERTVQADPGRLKQLLENLMSNAVEHGGQEVTITVGDLPDGFYVADDGPGIPAEESDDVFETGYSTTQDGTGFGLAIVRSIADAHDWEIRVTESEDGGARFEITGVGA